VVAQWEQASQVATVNETAKTLRFTLRRGFAQQISPPTNKTRVAANDEVENSIACAAQPLGVKIIGT
jgi:hypothetical protein